MTTFDILKRLCEEQKISIVELEEKLGFGKNSLYGWKRKIPNGANLEKVADYFDVSVDYLLGRTDKRRFYNSIENDEQDIQKIQIHLQRILEVLSKSEPTAFNDSTLGELSKEELEDIELLLLSLESSLRLAKRVAKQKLINRKDNIK